MDVEFIASITVIAPDPAESRKLYIDALGLPLEAGEGDDYFHSEHIAGSRHFGVWPLTNGRPLAVARGRHPRYLVHALDARSGVTQAGPAYLVRRSRSVASRLTPRGARAATIWSMNREISSPGSIRRGLAGTDMPGWLVLLLIALGLPRTILADLGVVAPESSSVYYALALVPFGVWLAVALFRRTRSPIRDHLVVGTLYGLSLVIVHEAIWATGSSVGSHPPQITALVIAMTIGLGVGVVAGIIAAVANRVRTIRER